MRRSVISILASWVLVAACGGKIAPPEQGQDHSGDLSGTPSSDIPILVDGGVGADSCGTVLPIATSVADTCGQGCGFPPGHPHALATTAEFQAMFVRRWVTCGQPTISGRADEAGFEAHADGTYVILVYDAGHNLVPDGTNRPYTIESNSTAWELHFEITPTSSFGAVGTITDSPRMLALSDLDVRDLHYVPADDTDWPDDGHGVCTGGVYVPPARCDAPRGATHAVASDTEFSALLSKRWVQCSVQGIGRDNPMHAGLDVRSDGTFNLLDVDPSNALLPATNVYDQGHIAIPPFGPPPEREIFFMDRMGASWTVTVSFTEPGEMILESNGVNEYRYVPLDVPCNTKK